METGKSHETIRQLVVSIVEDFRKQLDGPFHRGGTIGLSFSIVRVPEDDKVCGFGIVTGGSEWQEGLSTIRTVSEMGVSESTLSGGGENPEEQKVYRVWMNVETLEGLHRFARRYVEEAEASRDRSGRIKGETALYDRFLEEALSYYDKQASAIDCRPE